MAFAPGAEALALTVLVWLAKAGLDGATARALRGHGFGARVIWLSPLKDLLFLVAWARAFGVNTVEWRGNRLLVQAGSRLERIRDPASEGVLALGR
jgi:GNAT superfamily N-acetyltransferase